MRIGDFAAKYKQPLNSIYYYIKIGLLVPAKKATQYDFDEMCEQDLQMIIIFKQWDFSLKEIHAVLSLYRYSNLMHPDDIKGVTDFMDHKCRLLLEEKERLEQIIGQISQARQNIQNSFDLNPPRCSGVPLCMLELLVCPHCGQELRIEDAMMNPRYIFNSKLNCSCGYQAQIKNGILLTPNTNRSACDHPDLQRHQYTDMPLDVVSLYQRAYNWMGNWLSAADTRDKVVLETHINAYFILQMYLKQLSPSGKYIVVDKFPEMLSMYKNLIDRQDVDLDILFIADDSIQLPLRRDCVDIFLDFFSCNEHKFYSKGNLLTLYAPYFKESSRIIGTYFYFPDGPLSLAQFVADFPDADADNFNLEKFHCELTQAGIKLLDSYAVGETYSSGGRDSTWGLAFHIDGEKLCLSSYVGEKQKRQMET